MIVYTRGRVPNSDQDYRATEDSEFTDIPIVMLVNRNSASASEIVTGALQDHDRAYLVGETTFGKALVQSVYRISGGAGLALTTAHYYTPSGRLIQRPWDATFDEYLSYTLRDQDANKPHNAERPEAHRRRPPGLQRRRHRAGQARRRPARRLQPDAASAACSYARGEFANYAQKFTAEGDTRITQTSTGRKLVKPQLRRRRRDGGRLPRAAEDGQASRSTKTAFAKDVEFIKAMIRFEIDDALFGIADARRHLIGVDPQAQVALHDVRRGAEADRARQGRESRRTTEAALAGSSVDWSGIRPQSIVVAVCSCPYS